MTSLPDTSRATPAISVIVPATDAPPTLDRCLTALEASTLRPLEVIVIDRPRAAGPAAARNRGAVAARGEILVFVDADVEVDGEALGRIGAGLASGEIGAVFGAYDDDPAERDVVSLFRNVLHHWVHNGAPGPAETFWAGLGGVRARDFHAVGGFDDARFPHAAIEDVVLGMRLRREGTRIQLDPRIRGRHLKRWTFGRMVRTDFSARAVPWARLLLEDGGPIALNTAGRHRASAAASAGLVLAMLGRRRAATAAAAGAVVALNAGLLRLLWARGGAHAAAAGLPLKVVHDLSAATGLVAGVFLHARRGRQ
jgi:hypothetical protein